MPMISFRTKRGRSISYQGKRKRKSLKRKSSAARQNDNHGKRNDGAGGNH